jgi:hypothetical protein
VVVSCTCHWSSCAIRTARTSGTSTELGVSDPPAEAGGDRVERVDTQPHRRLVDVEVLGTVGSVVAACPAGGLVAVAVVELTGQGTAAVAGAAVRDVHAGQLGFGDVGRGDTAQGSGGHGGHHDSG